jgi:hypothetical protein
MLQLLPPEDIQGLNTIIFRQPTRKQESIAPNWGRLAYSAELSIDGCPPKIFGPSIFLEAHPEAKEFSWRKDLSPDAQAELDRLRRDGHQVIEKKREWMISSDPVAIRNTQLFRTLLHEVGHWVDYLEKVERPLRENPDAFDQLSDLYHARPRSEKEAFAHRYANEQARRLAGLGLIPFASEVPEAI